MKVGDLVKSVQSFKDTKMGIIIKKARKPKRAALNDLWLVHWFDSNPFDEQVYDYDLVLINESR